MTWHWKRFFGILGGFFLLYLAIYYWPSVSAFVPVLFSAAAPLLAGLALAYLVNILMAFYERHFLAGVQGKWVRMTRRPVCMLGAMLSILAIIVLISALVVPQLTSCIALVLEELPDSLDKLVELLAEHDILPEDITALLSGINWEERIEQIAGTLVSGVGNMLGAVAAAVTSVISVVTTAVLALIFSIYLLAGKERLARQSRHFLEHYLPDRWYRRLMSVLSVLNDCFHKFIVGQCIEAVILGGLCALGMLILRLPYAPMIGALIGFTALIPVVGAFIGGAAGAFLILMVSPVKALIFLVFLVVLQQLEGNLIYPRVVGTSIGLPGIWVLAVVTIGGGVFGIFGILIGIPLTAAVYRLIDRDMHRTAPSAEEAPE